MSTGIGRGIGAGAGGGATGGGGRLAATLGESSAARDRGVDGGVGGAGTALGPDATWMMPPPVMRSFRPLLGLSVSGGGRHSLGSRRGVHAHVLTDSVMRLPPAGADVGQAQAHTHRRGAIGGAIGGAIAAGGASPGRLSGNSK